MFFLGLGNPDPDYIITPEGLSCFLKIQTKVFIESLHISQGKHKMSFSFVFISEASL